MKETKTCPICEKEFEGRQNQYFCSTKCKNKEHNSNRKLNVYDEYKSQQYEIEKLNKEIISLKTNSIITEQLQAPKPDLVQDEKLLQEIELQKKIIEEQNKELQTEKQKSVILNNEISTLQSQLLDTTKDDEIIKLKRHIKNLTKEKIQLKDLLKNKIPKISAKQSELKDDLKYRVKTIQQAQQKEIEIEKLNNFIAEGIGKITEAIFK